MNAKRVFSWIPGNPILSYNFIITGGSTSETSAILGGSSAGNFWENEGSGGEVEDIPTPTVDGLILNSNGLTKAEKQRLEAGIGVLKRKFPKAKVLFDKLLNNNLKANIVCESSFAGTIKYNYATNTLTFSSMDYAASYGALEDWAHVLQYLLYYKQIRPEIRNVEFEAKVFCDLNCRMNPDLGQACGAVYGGFTSHFEISDFLDRVKDAGKFTSELLDEYIEFGKLWNDPYYQQGTFKDFPPILLMEIFK